MKNAVGTGMSNEAKILARKHGGHWGEHPEHSQYEWVIDVSENNTRLGYWDWVLDQIDANERTV